MNSSQTIRRRRTRGPLGGLPRWAALGALMFSCAAVASAQEARWLTVRLLPNASPETLKYIAEVTQPKRMTVHRGETFGEFVKWRYGVVNSKTWELFQTFNPGLEQTAAAAEDMEVVVPAGPLWLFKVEKPIPAGSTVLKQALFEMGVAGEKTQNDLEELNPTLRGRLGEVGAAARAVFPYVTRAASFKLLPRFARQPEAIIERLKNDPAVIVREFGAVSMSRLVPHWERDRLANLDEPCGEAPGEEHWYLREAALDRIPPNSLRGGAETVIAVLDSGIVQGDARFNLWENLRQMRGPRDLDNDNNLCFYDEHGCNMLDLESFPEDDLTLPNYAYHGTHVAGIASGELITDPYLRAEFDRRLRLMILKVAAANAEVSPSAVASAVIYAKEKRVGIVNLSLTLYRSLDIRNNFTNAKDQMLFVAAAGNGQATESGRVGFDLDDEHLYPATLSRELTNVITVGALDGEGGRACFSNYGARTVDLLAPGVDIESTVGGNGNATAKLSGTSQAAAFVSLAAALLASQGVNEPALIKQRILSAVDYVPALRGVVFSEGKLNVAKAVAIDRDLLELRDGTLLRGTLQEPYAIRLPGARDERELSSVNKVVFNYSDVPGKTARVTLVEPKGRLQHVYCDLDVPVVKFLVEGEQTPRDIPAGDIVDLIPRLVR